MNILVTGSSGFIGSHFVEKLLENNHTVIGLDNLDPYYNPNYKRHNLNELKKHSNFISIEGSFLDNDLLNLIAINYNIEVIVHLGARAGVRTSLYLPIEYSKNNIIGTLNLLEIARKHNINKFVFASSSSVYGESANIPFSEVEACDKPESPYAASKRSCELFGYNYHSLYGIDFTALRFFTVYGPRSRPDMAIFRFFNSIFKRKKLYLYGDGTASRDFTYITDITNGIFSAMNKKLGYEIINLGMENPISIKTLINKIEQIVGKKAIIEQLPKQKGDVKKTYANISKARRLLDFNPVIDIDTGLQLFFEWYKENRHRFV